MDPAPPNPAQSDRARRRFERQYDRLSALIPGLGGPMRRVRGPRWWMVRIPLGLFFIAGGFLAILPVFGLWMIPLGLMLLAIDLPLLQGPVTGASIRLRRRIELALRRWRAGRD